MMQKNNPRNDAQTSAFLTLRNLVLHNTFVACSLYSAITKTKKEALVEKHEDMKHFPCISLVSHWKAH